MNKYSFLSLLAGVLLLFIMQVPGGAQGPITPVPETKGKNSGFSLPKRHTTLTFVEQKGKALYDFYCSLCHGTTGNGDGFNSFNLTKQPAKFADPQLLAKLSDAQIAAVIKKGGTALNLSPQMPSWGDLFMTPEISALTAYLRTLSKTGGGSGK